MGLILSNSQHDLCDAKNEHTIAHVQGIKSEQILVCVSDPSVQEGVVSRREAQNCPIIATAAGFAAITRVFSP